MAEKFVLGLPTDNGKKWKYPQFTCSMCYTIVATSNRQKHEDWHNRLRDLIESLILFPNSVVIQTKLKDI